MPSMCDSDLYEPIEGLPSVCEHLYTYYLWAPDGTTPPDDKHVVINNWHTIHHHICCDRFPQITIATSHLSQEETKEIALSMFRLSASDVFFWSGGLRCKLDRKDYQPQLLSTKWYLISPDLEMQRANYEKHPNLESLLKVMDLTKVDPSIYIDDRDITGREFEAIVKALKDLGIQRIYRTNCFQSTEV